MIKLSLVLAIIGLALLVLSALPGRPATSAAQVASATPLQPTAVPPTALSADSAYGRALFSAKGCATCHHHAAVAGSGFGVGSDIPDLTTYRWTAEFLRTWLKDPAALRPNTDMPNLHLKQEEIEALIAFLSAGKNGT
ncbi:MAG TPA: c-type cytochrome [Roseiflexaceae bacterium]|nr:c-type cytochrome [Roseiflexaceae bacterium]